MEFRILGPLEVIDDDGLTVTVRSSRERALLALLLLSPNRVVSSERLADDLWGDRPPEDAAHALQVNISRLRKALRDAGAGDVLVTRPPGYLVEVDPDSVDAARFEGLLTRAREEAAREDHARAAATLSAALGLWRGPALADVADAPLARAEAARLEEARLTALEERLDADLACGRHGALVAELEALTRAHPLRERLWGQRMVALYRAGRQADALRAYQDLRTTLGDELGLHPSSALQGLEGAILRQEPELEWRPRATVASPDSSPAGVPAASGVVTFLFTDLVGSTELLDRLGDDDAEALRRTYFSLLRRAVSDAGGEEVKNLGDGLMVVFTSAIDAVRCAIAIQESIAEHNRATPPASLAVRVGLHAGEPVRHEDDFFGTAVVIAKRLCDRADGGQILASALLTELVGTRGGFHFVPCGPLALKGLAVPVATMIVGWEATGGGAPRPAPPEAQAEPDRAVPMPNLLTDIGRVFVGRKREQKELAQLWGDALDGRRRLALLAGEPGVGKTRLVAQFARRVHAEGVTVVAGRCDEDLGVPYQPFVESLRHFVEHVPNRQLATDLGRHAGELVRVHPDLAVRLAGLPPPLSSDPETERYRLFEAVTAWLAAISADRPALLVLDDLQWATKPTLLLLRHVMRSAEQMRLLILGTYRDTELSPDHPLTELLADFRRQSDVERLSLSGLDQEEVATFMAEAAGHEIDEDGLALARTIHGGTEGNPFFVREIIRHLRETGDIEQRAGRWGTSLPVDELGVPDSVREVITRRLARLSDDANRALRLGAVIGAEFELPVVRTASGFDDETVLSALEEAIDARLVADVPGPRPRYRFAHALVRAALYDELSAARQAALHRKVADAIETVHGHALDDHLPALAHHWARASSSSAETARAVDYARRAGDRALAQFANDEAATYYRQALDLLASARVSADDERRVELLIGLGEAQRRAGERAHRETLLEAARLAADRGDAGAQVRAVLANGRGVWPSAIGETDDERVAALEAALALVRHHNPTRARLLAALGLELTYMVDPERRMRLADDALAIARSSGDAATLVHVLLQRFFTVPAPSTLPERLANSAELIALAESLGDPGTTARALLHRARCLMEAGDFEGADRALEAAEGLADDLAQPTLRWLVGSIVTTRTILAGDFEEGERQAHIGFELGQATGQREAPTFLGGHLFLIRFDQGRLGELEQLLAERMAAVPNLMTVPAVLAMILCELDRPDEAIEHYERLVGHLDDLPVDTQWMLVVPACAAVCARVGDRPRARLLFDLLARCASEVMFGAYIGLGAKDYYLALLATTLGDFNEAERRYADAASTHERIGAPHWLARTRLEWARMLLLRRRPGDLERAQELLGRVLTVARERGLANIERRAVELLP
jgi:DNA-binding SARP family transcriptional activator